MESYPAEKVPAFDAKGSSFQYYEKRVRLWMRSKETGPAGRASTSVLQMNSVPRRVCFSARGDHLDDQTGVARILEVLRRYFAVEAAGASYRQSIDEFIAGSDLRAESRMERGTGFPEQFASILRTHYAGLPRQKKKPSDGRQSEEPDVYGGGGERAQIIWIAQWRLPSGCVDHGGSGRAFAER